jgi:hypothetical protein
VKAPKAPGCNLKILLARKSPVGVIFRRGPSRWVQLIHWNTETDQFKAGQWFHGHIYEGRSDLSPDGSLLVYFANKFNRKTVTDKEYTYAWTAVSKPPYLTALALWPKGDCWHGGGLFEGPYDLFLNHRPAAAVPHPKHMPKGLRVRPNPSASGEDDPILVPRMERDGWKFVQWLDYDYSRNRTEQPAISEKKFSNGRLKLRVEKYVDRNEQLLCYVVNGKGARMEVGVGSWADIDQQGRLVFAAEGKLFAGTIKKDEVVLTELADFRSAKPSSVKPVAWAQRW